MFYHVSQNNSGGIFDFDEKVGITHHLIIEGDNAQDANKRLNKIINHEDYDRSYDCPCCGDRWSDIWSKGDDKPSVYGQPVGLYADTYGFNWMKGKPEICIHYKDGLKIWFDGTKKEKS